MKWQIAAAAACAAAIVAVAIWNPFARPSLEESTVKLLPPPGVAAPAGRDDVLVVFYSGDGGWRDLDKQVGSLLVAHGMPVLGVSMLNYYWHVRTPEQSAQELDAMITRYLAAWHKQRVWLIGFSFGADVLPTLIDKLGPTNRARISQLVLLSPSRDVNFEIELEGYMRENWLKTHTKAVMEWLNPVPHYPSLPRIEALDGRPPVICYYGVEDSDDSLCSMTGLPSWLKVHAMPGDHHFNYDYPGLVTRMIGELPASQAAAPAAVPAP